MRFPRQFGLLLIAALVVIPALLTGARTAWACSGPPTTLNVMWESSTHLVRARLVEADAAGQNSIVLVESSLGESQLPEYILVQMQTPANTQGLFDQFFMAGGCTFAASPLPEHAPVYLYVSPLDNGAFRSGFVLGPDYYQFSAAQPTQVVHLDRDANHDGQIAFEEIEERAVDEAEFVALAEEIAGLSFAPPRADAPYPVTAPLVVETEDGGLWFVPLDLSAPSPIELAEIGDLYAGLLDLFHEVIGDCAPHGEVACEVRPEPGYQTFRLYRDGEPGVFLNRYGYPLESGDLLINSTAGTALIWDERTLTYYAPVPHATESGYHTQLQRESFPMASPARDATVWSPDARQFAYGNEEGVWLVSLTPTRFSEFSPGMVLQKRLMWPTTYGQPAPEPVRFSPFGRFLTIQDWDEEFNLDLNTGLPSPGGIVSPDERYVLTCDSPDGNTGCRVSALNRPDVIFRYSILRTGERLVQAEWLHELGFVALICGADDVCRVEYRSTELELDSRTQWQTAVEPGHALAVSPRGDLALVTDGDTISVNRHPIDIDTDSPIVNVYWLPSLFWGE